MEMLARTVVGADPRVIPHNQPGDGDGVAFLIFEVDSVIPDLRRGHHQNLAGVTGIGEGLLIATHGRIEDDFATGRCVGTESSAFEDRPIFQCKANPSNSSGLFDQNVVSAVNDHRRGV